MTIMHEAPHHTRDPGHTVIHEWFDNHPRALPYLVVCNTAILGLQVYQTFVRG